jgi:hypothetical protein
MAQAFHRQGAALVARLRPHEVEILRGLVGDVQRLVAEDTPPNPMTARLFPDPSPDPVAAADLRELIQDDLREAKRAAARALLESLPDDGRLALDDETAEQWLTALNDVRLALGTALGVTEESYESDDPTMDVYHWLTYLQGSLIEALSPGLDG